MERARDGDPLQALGQGIRLRAHSMRDRAKPHSGFSQGMQAWPDPKGQPRGDGGNQPAQAVPQVHVLRPPVPVSWDREQDMQKMQILIKVDRANRKQPSDARERLMRDAYEFATMGLAGSMDPQALLPQFQESRVHQPGFCAEGEPILPLRADEAFRPARAAVVPFLSPGILRLAPWMGFAPPSPASCGLPQERQLVGDSSVSLPGESGAVTCALPADLAVQRAMPGSAIFRGATSGEAPSASEAIASETLASEASGSRAFSQTAAGRPAAREATPSGKEFRDLEGARGQGRKKISRSGIPDHRAAQENATGAGQEHGESPRAKARLDKPHGQAPSRFNAQGLPRHLPVAMFAEGLKTCARHSDTKSLFEKLLRIKIPQAPPGAGGIPGQGRFPAPRLLGERILLPWSPEAGEAA